MILIQIYNEHVMIILLAYILYYTLTNLLGELSNATTFMYDAGDSIGHTEPIESDGKFIGITLMYVHLRLLNQGSKPGA